MKRLFISHTLSPVRVKREHAEWRDELFILATLRKRSSFVSSFCALSLSRFDTLLFFGFSCTFWPYYVNIRYAFTPITAFHCAWKALLMGRLSCLLYLNFFGKSKKIPFSCVLLSFLKWREILRAIVNHVLSVLTNFAECKFCPRNHSV